MPILSHFPSGGTDTRDATANASGILSGETAYVNDSKITGTMPNKVSSGTIIVPRTSDIVIPQGYFGGAAADGKVQGDANLIPENILSGKSIFNVNGSAITGIQHATGNTTVGSSAPYTLTVTGLNFTPSTVILLQTNKNGTTFGETFIASLDDNGSTYKVSQELWAGNQSSSSFGGYIAGNAMSVSATGFTQNTASAWAGRIFTWFAYE